MYSIAFDLGTTTLAGSLINTKSGERLASTGSMNPQRSFGADVVSRLQKAVESDKLLHSMSQIIRQELWRLVMELCTQSALTTDKIQQIAIAGNPAMQHILLQLPVKTLASPPYRPKYTEGTYLKASEIGWQSESKIYIFPMPGGFVGGDTVAFLYSELHKTRQTNFECPPTLYLDIGTNGEIALVSEKTIWATSAAAGPAFEGGNLSCGMTALPGAINSVLLDNEKLKTTTIGNLPAIGICGSAALQTVVQLLKHNILELNGRLKENSEINSTLANRITFKDEETAFLLYRDATKKLTLTQNDIRQIQLAKSALRAGIEILFGRAKVDRNNLAETVLTGSFGAFLEPEWLKSIGIFDKCMVQMCRFTPEGALKGVEQALFADDNFASTESTAKQFKVVPLSGTPTFEKLFINNINFPLE